MKHEIKYLRCCYVWPVVSSVAVGRCGKCGERPQEEVTRREYLTQKEQ